MKVSVADQTDVPSIAAIARQARSQAMPWLPVLHTLEGDQKFYANRVLPNMIVQVATHDDVPVAFIAYGGDWIDHLYVAPPYWRSGLGTELLRCALDSGTFWQLWVFQQNHPAQNFYAKHGFIEAMRTDGSGNEERCPDVRMEWHA